MRLEWSTENLETGIVALQKMMGICIEIKQMHKKLGYGGWSWTFDKMTGEQRRACEKCTGGENPSFINEICSIKVTGRQIGTSGEYLHNVPVFSDCVLYGRHGYLFVKDSRIANRTLNTIIKLCRRNLELLENKRKECTRQSQMRCWRIVDG